MLKGIESQSPIVVEFRGKGEFAYQTSLSVGADLVAQEFDHNSPYAEKIKHGWDYDSACWVLCPYRPLLIPTGVFIIKQSHDANKEFVDPNLFPDPWRSVPGVRSSFMYSLDVRPRSSLSTKAIMASLGTIDSDYVELEILACLTLLHGIVSVAISPGDRIGQLVGQVNFRIGGIPVKEVSRQGGFGSTNP